MEDQLDIWSILPDSVVSVVMDWSTLLSAVLISVLACCRAVAITLAWRRRTAQISTDVALRAVWFLTIAIIAWSPYLLKHLRQDPKYDWLMGIWFACFDWGIHAVLITLLCASLVSARQHQSRHSSAIKVVFAVTMGVGILAALSDELAMIPGLVSIAILSTEVAQGHVFSHFSMEPKGANIKESVGAILNATYLGLASAGACSLVFSSWIRKPKRWKTAIWLPLLATAAFLAFYTDANLVRKLSAPIGECCASQNARQSVTIILFALPVTTMIGWKISARSCDKINIEKQETPIAEAIHWTEFAIVLTYGISAYVHFYCTCQQIRGFNPALWEDNPWGWLPQGVFFFHAMPFFACAFTSGRWIRMHWSRHLATPDEYYADMSVTRFAALTSVVTIQLVAFSVLLAWLMISILYFPSP